jgi:hypothetical protein
MDSLSICLSITSFFGLLFGFIVVMRFISYRQTLALAEKGLVKPPHERNGSGSKAALVWGVIIAALGLALMLGLWPLGFSTMGRGFPLGFGPWMLFGLVPLFFGLALVLIYVLTGGEGKKSQTPPEVPPQVTVMEELPPIPAAELPQESAPPEVLQPEAEK